MTFLKSDDTYGVYTHTKSVTFKRSIFGTVRNLDNGLTFDKNQEGGNDVVAGNNESGFYLGVIGFNVNMYPYQIRKLTEQSVSGLPSPPSRTQAPRWNHFPSALLLNTTGLELISSSMGNSCFCFSPACMLSA